MSLLPRQVGDIVSVIDMPPKEDTTWWRGKHGFQVHSSHNTLHAGSRKQTKSHTHTRFIFLCLFLRGCELLISFILEVFQGRRENNSITPRVCLKTKRDPNPLSWEAFEQITGCVPPPATPDWFIFSLHYNLQHVGTFDVQGFCSNPPGFTPLESCGCLCPHGTYHTQSYFWLEENKLLLCVLVILQWRSIILVRLKTFPSL